MRKGHRTLHVLLELVAFAMEKEPDDERRNDSLKDHVAEDIVEQHAIEHDRPGHRK